MIATGSRSAAGSNVRVGRSRGAVCARPGRPRRARRRDPRSRRPGVLRRRSGRPGGLELVRGRDLRLAGGWSGRAARSRCRHRTLNSSRQRPAMTTETPVMPQRVPSPGAARVGRGIREDGGERHPGSRPSRRRPGADGAARAARRRRIDRDRDPCRRRRDDRHQATEPSRRGHPDRHRGRGPVRRLRRYPAALHRLPAGHRDAPGTHAPGLPGGLGLRCDRVDHVPARSFRC